VVAVSLVRLSDWAPSIDDGFFDRCGCCDHRRNFRCGGPLCGCRVEKIEALNLHLRDSLGLRPADRLAS
jgi:hypothetical protein